MRDEDKNARGERKRLLLLGGTEEARELGNQLAANHAYETVTSLAGRTDNPLLPGGETRIGGFGGVGGLASYMTDQKIDILIDATHPFANRISSNAAEACEKASVKMLRLERPEWQPQQGDQWQSVDSLETAIDTIAENARVFATIGRQQLHAFARRADLHIVARAIEGPREPLPSAWELILDRPPFSLASEVALLKEKKIDVIVTKNAGSPSTAAKLEAARMLSLPVIMIERLKGPNVPSYTSVAEVLKALES